jgi:hypothetical protein
MGSYYSIPTCLLCGMSYLLWSIFSCLFVGYFLLTRLFHIPNSVKDGREAAYFPLEFLQQAAKEVRREGKNGEKAKTFALELANAFPGTKHVKCTQNLISKLQPNKSLVENGFKLIARPLTVFAKELPPPQLQFGNDSAPISARNGSWNLTVHPAPHQRSRPRLCFQT